MRTPSGYCVCARFRGWDVVVHLPKLIAYLHNGGGLNLESWHQLGVSDNPAELSRLHIIFLLTDARTGDYVHSTGGSRNGKLDDILLDVERPRIALDGCTITGKQMLGVQTEETIALGEHVHAFLARLMPIEERPGPMDYRASVRMCRTPQFIDCVCAIFRGCAIGINFVSLIRNVLDGGYPKLVSSHMMCVPGDPAEPSRLYLHFSLVYADNRQPLEVVRGCAVDGIGFEVERPRIDVEGYTLTDDQELYNVETEETIALREQILASVERVVLREARRNPNITTAIA